jgi:hypothetical protein
MRSPRDAYLEQADAAGIAVEFNEPLSNDELR